MQAPSDNVVIYGHHMNDGSMFAHLEKFKSKDFWEEHKIITFNTLTEKNEYEILAVFKTVVYTDSPDSFKYYHFTNADTPEEFTAFVDQCKELSLYDTRVSAEYGDKLTADVGDSITLDALLNRDDVAVTYQWQRKQNFAVDTALALYNYEEDEPTWYDFVWEDSTEAKTLADSPDFVWQGCEMYYAIVDALDDIGADSSDVQVAWHTPNFVLDGYTITAANTKDGTVEVYASNGESTYTAHLNDDGKWEFSDESTEKIPEIVEVDWSEYFNGLNGTAVIYDASNKKYTIYNRDLAITRSSPCSTFKIISSLIALENGIIETENSTKTWSGEIFWNEDWNKDIDFQEAFRTSCVWYFRQVIDDIGEDLMQKELDKLQYGNCDISDWEGRLNTNNSNRALTGFWIESSLMISPKEQVEVMEHIFGKESNYSEETQNTLKQVMLLSEVDSTDISIYGKTGMGKVDGIVVDAWFTGVAESKTGDVYFCVRLGRTDGMNVSSTLAKEIAIDLVQITLQ